MKLWYPPSAPPLLRRLTSKKSYSDLAFVKKTNLSRGNSKQSEKTLVEAQLPKSEKAIQYAAEFDVLLIDAPPLPPKDPSPPTSPASALTADQSLLEQPNEKPVQNLEPTAEHHALHSDKSQTKPLPMPDTESDPGDSEPIYPWYRRRLHSPTDSTSQYTASQLALFPRSDFAMSTSGSSRAGLNLFGGLVNDRAKNDVYTVSVNDQSVTRLHTIGDVPPPRFGQASAYAGSVVVVWGGDTTSASSNQLRARPKYDNGLYFLNLVSREWTRIHVNGPAPQGRIGHSVVMIGPKVYVFGGEANGQFFNDLWCFELSTLISKPAWQQIELPKSIAEKPAPRSGHVCVTYKDQLIIFGGTDGQYHYNDTWAFDTTTKAWCELPCTGYIPSPREGHAAALVDDIIYVFGGHGVSGANIGQLAAFKITSKRWFMFQNMGPEPSPRSGHGMAAVGSKVYVLGGVCEDNLVADGKESNVMYILETNSIKYPPTKPREKLSPNAS